MWMPTSATPRGSARATTACGKSAALCKAPRNARPPRASRRRSSHNLDGQTPASASRALANRSTLHDSASFPLPTPPRAWLNSTPSTRRRCNTALLELCRLHRRRESDLRNCLRELQTYALELCSASCTSGGRGVPAPAAGSPRARPKYWPPSRREHGIGAREDPPATAPRERRVRLA